MQGSASSGTENIEPSWTSQANADSPHNTNRTALHLTFMSGWILLLGNWLITLSINFGFASFLSAVITIFDLDYDFPAWKLLLVFYAMCLVILAIYTFGNRYLPAVDTFYTA